MWKKFGAALTALSVLGATIAMPAPAAAHDRRYRGDGYYDDYRRGDGYYGGGYRHRDDDDDDDAVVAGVVGLALGAIIGAAVAQSDERRDDGRRNYERDYPPPPNYGYRDDYRQPERTCYRRERQWDPYANRYLWVDVPYAC